MAANTTGIPARQYEQQLMHFMRRQIAFNTALIGTDDSIQVGTLPAGAVVYDAIVKVTTAFNAGTNNLINIGIVGDDDGLLDETDIDATSAEVQSSRRGCDLSFADDTPVYVTYDQSGTAATAGVAEIIVMYIPDNDL